MFKNLSILKKVLIVLVALLVVVLGTSIYFFIKYQSLAQDPTLQAKAKTAEVVKELSKLMVVPNDPNTVMATITDKSKLAGQKFFDLAQNGDEVVLFPGALKAVIYRPSTHRIVDIGPFSPNADAATPAPTSSVQTTASTSTSASSTVKKTK